MPSRTKSFLSPVGVLALSLGAMACTGVMDGNKDGMNPGGPSGSTGGTTGTPVDPTVAKTQPVDPGHVEVHRLNTNEYNATVADILGTKLQPANPNWRGGELGGFDNMASVLGVDGDQYRRYFDAADAITKDVWANETARAKILTCTTQDDQACVKSILTTSGTRIFRRPLTDKELTTYAKVYAGVRAVGDDHSASVRLMIQSLLSSAEFLYRIEGDQAPNTTAKHPVTPYELASRLSYFLWGSAPDDQLLAAAANNTLGNDDVLAGAVDYMLGDAKSNRLVLNFAGQWLGIRRVVPHPAAPDIYPEWTPVVADAASQEMYLYFNEFLRSGRTWLDFMKADVNYVTPELAALYKMPVPAGATAGGAPVRVEGVADGRTGFAGLVGFLAMSSPDRRSSPTLRGKWLLMNMMCTTPPDPPANIPVLEKKGDTSVLNVRQVLEEHRANPACAACHALFDPFGLALEQYDGIGKFRTTYPNMSVIDPATELQASSAYPNGLKFGGIEGANGLPGVADAVSGNPEFATCISQKMLTFSLGRLLTDTDKPYLDVVNQEWLKSKSGATPSIARLIHGLVGTETFRYRRGEGT
jgi:hypothetical protein